MLLPNCKDEFKAWSGDSKSKMKKSSVLIDACNFQKFRIHPRKELQLSDQRAVNFLNTHNNACLGTVPTKFWGLFATHTQTHNSLSVCLHIYLRY